MKIRNLVIPGVIAGGLYLLLRGKEKPAPLPEEAGADIKITILDAAGNPVPHSSPYTLVEGNRYILSTTVTNKSTKAGSPVAATLSLGLNVGIVGGIGIISPSVTPANFAAGEQRTFTINLDVPVGYAGQKGDILANVQSPAGKVLAGVYEVFDIGAAEIIYAATITVTV